MKIEVDLMFYILLLLLFIKSIFLGGSFSIHLWIKYGKEYADWFYSRDFEKEREKK